MKEEAKGKGDVLRKLFFSCLYLSTFTFGGGYVIVTLMKKKFVDDYHWIDENEMLDLVAIAQSSPGPIAVNGAIVVGYKLAGIFGAMTAILGTIIPPFLIISVISVGYHSFRDSYLISQILEGMQAGVGAVIASVVYEMGVGIAQEKDKISLLIMAGAFAASCVYKINVVYIIIACGMIGVITNLPFEEGRREMIYLYLFVSFLQVGMFSFGGGYAAMPLIQEQVVTIHHWLNISEFTDLVTISQMTPGPISINAATFVGIKVAGIPGAIVATGGCILPSCVIVMIIAKVYLKYRKMGMLQGILNALRPAVIAMIASAGISILITAFWGTAVIKLINTNWSLVIIFVICFALLQKLKMNPIGVMVLAGIMKLGLSFIKK